MKKRKKLHGDSAQKAREILEAFCLEKLELRLDMIAETSDDKSYLSRLQGELILLHYEQASIPACFIC